MSVQPDSSYTLTGHVRGSYVHLGASGIGTTDVSAWIRSAPDRFVLTMAPETYFVQNGYQYYGAGKWGGQDPRCGACFPVIHALRDDLTLPHVQDDDSGPITGLDNQYHSVGGADFHIAMTDMLLTGFPVAGDPDHVCPPLRPDQVAIATAPGRTCAA